MTTGDVLWVSERLEAADAPPTGEEVFFAVGLWAAGVDPHYKSAGVTVSFDRPTERLAAHLANAALPAELEHQVTVAVPPGLTASGPAGVPLGVAKQVLRRWLGERHPTAHQATVGVQLNDGEYLFAVVNRHGDTWLSPRPQD